jgi:restriction system protein
MGRRRSRRGSNAAAFMFVAAIAALVIASEVAHIAERQAAVLTSIGVCALAVAVAVLAVRHRRQQRARETCGYWRRYGRAR